ncbi:tetratricopeptide repeat protein [Dactylosporangium vinaceum]|uniref:Tetratricopeptide repeat protein n=1 Tax=Dactylosporangium vinaceum TaxID=53362 RepID=A0ABV5MJ22_9ACTN|nr:tetratricopeptide repeat protein [Dactylosporangium vinaceum]UAB93692.1 tetratricopeptide repeat protein [Dactylosporangium vinaceum]
MAIDGRIERARAVYRAAVYGGDVGELDDAARGLDAVEADVALARGLLLHARFQHGGVDADPAELQLFERALELYEGLHDERGQAEALFWIGCVHQFIRRDDPAAVPFLERAERLAAQVGDRAVRSEALRHLGISAHLAGRLDEARDRLEESSRLRREDGNLAGVASNMVGLAYIAAAQDRHAAAVAILDEAGAIVREHGAHAIERHVEEARTQI